MTVAPKYLTDEQVMERFGNPAPFILPDGHVSQGWEDLILTTISLPAPLPLSWDLERRVSSVRCHKMVADQLLKAFQSLFRGGVWHLLKDYAGCYAWRVQRFSGKLSRHSWAVAIDLNANDNPFMAEPKMDLAIVEAFEEQGFLWGGNFKRRPDGMHFEWGIA